MANLLALWVVIVPENKSLPEVAYASGSVLIALIVIAVCLHEERNTLGRAALFLRQIWNGSFRSSLD
jgi:hypothetical protein